MGLELARERGLHRVLLTCDETNIGSRKVIENNGGQLENAVEVEGQTVLKMRYWINLDRIPRRITIERNHNEQTNVECQ
jgi:predicted acetyltransferase